MLRVSFSRTLWQNPDSGCGIRIHLVDSEHICISTTGNEQGTEQENCNSPTMNEGKWMNTWKEYSEKVCAFKGRSGYFAERNLYLRGRKREYILRENSKNTEQRTKIAPYSFLFMHFLDFLAYFVSTIDNFVPRRPTKESTSPQRKNPYSPSKNPKKSIRWFHAAWSLIKGNP